MTAGAEHVSSQQAGPVGPDVGPGPYRVPMTTADTLALPFGRNAEDDFLDLVEEAGERAITLLLEECRTAVGAAAERPGAVPVEAALEDLASALADALLDDDLGAPRGISPHSPLRDHPDFPEGSACESSAPCICTTSSTAAQLLRSWLGCSRVGGCTTGRPRKP